MKILKKAIALTTSLLMAVSTTAITDLTTISTTYAVSTETTENVTLKSKQSIIHEDMNYLVETYSDSSIIIKAQYTGNDNTTLKNFDVITIETPIVTYDIAYATKQNGGTWGQWGDIEYINKNNNELHTYSLTATAGSLVITKGLVGTFTLTPVTDNIETNSVKIYDTAINNISNIPTSASEKINALEQENAALKSEIERLTAEINSDNITKLDANSDNMVDAVDATILLSIYAVNSTGGHISTLTEYYESLTNENVTLDEPITWYD